jgi:F-type H+-transporting ATPase subunit b
MQINLTPDITLPVIMLIFLANYFVVRKYFLKPVNDILVARETEIRSADKMYEDSLASFNAAAEEIETRLQRARREGSSLREEHRQEASLKRASLIERTRAEADGIARDAGRQLDELVTAARTQIATDSDRLAREAAERIVGRRLA